MLGLIIQAVAVGFVAVRVSGHLARPDAPLDRWLVGLVLILAQVVGVSLVLGSVHLLFPLPLVFVHSGTAAVVGWRVERVALVRSRPTLGAAASMAVLVLLAALSLALGLNGRSLETDTVQYHASGAAHFAVAGDLWTPPFAAPGFFGAGYPGNLELSAAWIMNQTGSDVGVYAINVLWSASLILAMAVVTRELAGRAWTGALAGAALISAPVFLATQTHSLMTDTAATAGTVAGLALILVGRNADPPKRWTWWMLVGASLGLSIGAKYTAWIPAGAVLVCVLFLGGHAKLSERLRRGAIVAGAAGAFLVTWIARNVTSFGDPIYPADVTLGDHVVFQGGESVFQRYEAPMLSHILAGRSEPLRGWVEQTWANFGLVVIVSGVGIGLGLFAAVRHRRDAGIVTAVAVVSTVGYLVTPYTGGGEEGALFLITSQLRYSMAAHAIALTLAAALLPPRWSVPFLGMAIAWGLIRAYDGPNFRGDLAVTPGVAVVTVVLFAGLLATAWVHLRPGLAPWHRIIGSTVVVALSATVGVAWAYRGRDNIPADYLAAVDAAQAQGGVLVAGAYDVRALLGSDLDGTLLKATAGGVGDEKDIQDGDVLVARIEAINPPLVAVGAPSILLPANWTPPPDWDIVSSFAGDVLYRLPESSEG